MLREPGELQGLRGKIKYMRLPWRCGFTSAGIKRLRTAHDLWRVSETWQTLHPWLLIHTGKPRDKLIFIPTHNPRTCPGKQDLGPAHPLTFL